MAKQTQPIFTREIAGILFILASILMACSLFSFDPQDLPFNHSPPTTSNWVGIVGAYLGFGVYFLLGWTAKLLPLLLIYLGASTLFRDEFNWIRSVIWLGTFIVLFPCLLQSIGGENQRWNQSNQYFFGWGGLVGYSIGGVLFWTYLKIGAVIIFAIGSGACLYFGLQFKPMEVYEWIRDQISQFRALKRHVALQSGDIQTVLRTREDEIAERQRLIERELQRRSKSLSKIQRNREEDPEPVQDEVKPEPEELSSTKESSPSTATAVEAVKPTPTVFHPKIHRTEKTKPVSRPPVQTNLFGTYKIPSTDLLRQTTGDVLMEGKEEISRRAAVIETTLRDFGIEVTMGEITQGATITRYEVVPSPGVKVERIVNLSNNLSMALKTDKVNIVAPVPGKGTVGIEVANDSKAPVAIRELIESREFQKSPAKIPLALGKDVYGKTLIMDMAEMPHLLIAGSTGAGKSVCINSILASILYRFSPEDLRLIMVDPKVVELQIYNSLPHLVIPVVSEPKKVIVALRWVIREMEKRYTIMAKVGVRNINAFNSRPKNTKAPLKKEPTEEEDSDQPMLIPDEDVPVPEKMPYIVVIIDELADLMQTASVDAEDAIQRITSMARAAGIHLIVATQTPRADVVTGTIKTNLPAKIAFRVASKIDSRVILDENGAENLLGKGDMIFKSSDSSTLRRAQGAFISDDEVRIITEFCAGQAPASYDMEMQEKITKPTDGDEEELSDEDEEAIERSLDVIRQEKRASTSLLQRRLRFGYTRAARIMDLLEQRGYIGPSNGSRDREIFIPLDGTPTKPLS